MKLFVLALFVSVIDGDFTGCPMDGCESSLSHFVDLSIEGFDKQFQWRRTDLLTKASRGCVSNDRSSVLCALDVGYVSINATNGQSIWTIELESEEKSSPVSLPVINYAGFSIIANSTRCTLINPQGDIAGIFDYTPRLIGPLAGPFVTDDGQIIVADAVSFVGIEDSGIPLGVQALPSGFLRRSRSMSLMRDAARWYLVIEQKNSSRRAIVAAETSGSIVSRIRLAWTLDYGTSSDVCDGMEGPVLSVDRSWLFLINATGLVIVADQGDSATVQRVVPLSDLCAIDLAFSDMDSTLLILDKNASKIIVYNVSTEQISFIAFKDIYQDEIIGQLSRMTILPNARLVILVQTSRRTAVLLLIDYVHRSLVASLDLGSTSELPSTNTLTQLTYTQNDDGESFLIVAHQAIGLISIRLLLNDLF